MFFNTDDLQWCKKNEEAFFEFVEVIEGGEEYGFIKTGTVDLSDYNEVRILEFIEPYGYKNIETLKETYKDDYQQIIAECIFETEFHAIIPVEDLVHAKSILASDYGIELDWLLTDLIWVNDEGYITSEDTNEVKPHTPETLKLLTEGMNSIPLTKLNGQGVYEGIAVEGGGILARFAKGENLDNYPVFI